MIAGGNCEGCYAKMWGENVPEEQYKKRERHRKSDVGARVVVNEKAPGGYVARLGTIREIVLGSRYGVRFDNDLPPEN